MTPVECATGRGGWQDGEYFLTQEFLFPAADTTLDAPAIVREADDLVNQRTRATALGLARWHGDFLMLGSICVLRFGPLLFSDIADSTAAAERAILGGLIARRPGGTMWYRVHLDSDNVVLTAGLSGFVPRLPGILFQMLQLPLHRATTRRAMRELGMRLDS
jgi:hypothetical protein